MGNLKFVSLNLANWAQRVGEFVRLSPAQYEPIPEKPIKTKPQVQRDMILNMIYQEKPRILLLQEIEACGLELFMATKEGADYHVFSTRGNDGRGIMIATLVHKSLPVTAQFRSRQNLLFYDPVTATMQPLHSRDLTVLDLYILGSKKPFMSVLNSHFKSKRARPGDPESMIWRGVQYNDLLTTIYELREEFGPDHFIMLGADMNTDVQNSQELSDVRRVLAEGFDAAKTNGQIFTEPIITHTYHPIDGETHKAQMHV